MEDQKISELVATATVGASDLVTLVQSGVNKKIAGSDLTASIGGVQSVNGESSTAVTLTEINTPPSSIGAQPVNQKLTDISGISVIEGDLFTINNLGDVIRLGRGESSEVLGVEGNTLKWVPREYVERGKVKLNPAQALRDDANRTAVTDFIGGYYEPYNKTELTELTVFVANESGGSTISLLLFQDQDGDGIAERIFTVASVAVTSGGAASSDFPLKLTPDEGTVTLEKKPVYCLWGQDGGSGTFSLKCYKYDSLQMLNQNVPAGYFPTNYETTLSTASVPSSIIATDLQPEDKDDNVPIMLTSGPSFSILDLSPSIWFDASNISSLTIGGGNVINGVSDLSGNGYDLVGSGNVLYSATGFDGRPGLDFSNGTSARLDRFSTQGSDIFGTGEFTAFINFKTTVNGVQQWVFGWGAGSNAIVLGAPDTVVGVDGVKFIYGFISNPTGSIQGTVPNLTTANRTSMAITRSAGGTGTVYSDNVSRFSGVLNYATSLGALQTFSIGASYLAGSSNSNAIINEFAIVPRLCTPTEIQTVNDYFNNK